MKIIAITLHKLYIYKKKKKKKKKINYVTKSNHLPQKIPGTPLGSC